MSNSVPRGMSTCSYVQVCLRLPVLSLYVYNGVTNIHIPELAKKVSATHIGLRPEDIIWSNVNKSQFCGSIKGFIITVLIALLTIILFVPAVYLGFIGANDSSMNVMLSSDFMQRQTDITRGIITGLVPVLYVFLIKEFMTIVCKRESLSRSNNVF